MEVEGNKIFAIAEAKKIYKTFLRVKLGRGLSPLPSLVPKNYKFDGAR